MQKQKFVGMAFASENDGVELSLEALWELTQNINDDDFDYDFDASFNKTFDEEAQNLNIHFSEEHVERTRSGCAPETVPTCDSSFPPAKVAKIGIFIKT